MASQAPKAAIAVDEASQDMHSDIAMQHAVKGFFRGAMRWTIYGIIASGVAWSFSNTYRRLTLAGKGFLLMGFTLNGGMYHGEVALQRYERRVKETEGRERRAIYRALSKQGRIPSESEVRRYRAELANSQKPRSEENPQ